MPTLLDLLYVALFAVASPLLGYFVLGPRRDRQFQDDPTRARQRLYIEGVTLPWAVVAGGALLWWLNDRPWAALGLSVPDGWRLIVAVVLVLLLAAYMGLGGATVARDAKARASVREQMFGQTAEFMPHSKRELYWFEGVALTAGFCEEFLFRGYFIWAVAPWLGWWGAAALSLAIFAIGHEYQGCTGVLRTAVVGAFFTLVVAVTGSLWPAIVLHALLDLGQGIIAWLALRDGQKAADTADVERAGLDA